MASWCEKCPKLRSWLGAGAGGPQKRSASLLHFKHFPQKHANMLEELAGIRKNLLTGYISDQAERGGIHFLGPLKTFFVVPAAQGTLQWSWQGGDRAPVQTRTGADPQDPDSGGQPISISCAVQATCWKPQHYSWRWVKHFNMISLMLGMSKPHR